jgi:uncharacterized membrane protein
MAFCPSCGSPADGRFCAKCGSPIAAAPGATPGATPGGAPGSNPVPPPAQPAEALQENVACALCYLFITAIIFLVIEPYNKNRNIRFHAFQAIFLGVAIILAEFVLGILATMFLAVGMWSIVHLLSELFGLGCLVLWAMVMYKAYNGERWKLPVIGDFAEKQA